MDSTEQQYQSVRSRNQVRPLQETEDGRAIDDVPLGTYGYAYAPGSDATPLYAKRRYLAFEMHKLADGAVRLLGFLEPDLARKVEAGTEDLLVRLGADPTAEKSVLVEIPSERIFRVKEHSNRDGSGLVIDLAGLH